MHLPRPLNQPALLLCLVPLAPGLMAQSTCEPTVWTESVPASDGIPLAADIYQPATGPAPTILMRTPYLKESHEGEANTFMEQGFTVMSQDIRGTGASGGAYDLFRDDGVGEADDAVATLEWIGNQPFNGGSGVCTYGYSALAITSVLATAGAPDALRCAFVKAGDGDLFEHSIYQGGALRYETIVEWLRGLEGTAGQGALDSLQAVYDHPTNEMGYYDPISLSRRYESVNVPVYHSAGWYDLFLQGNIDAFKGVEAFGGPKARGSQKLIIGPWSHWGDVGQISFPNADVITEDYRGWFEHHLKGVPNGIMEEPAIAYFVMGDVDDALAPGNTWRFAESWPPPHEPTDWYLTEGGILSTDIPAADAPPAAFDYNPADPVPTLGGNTLTAVPGPWDQRLVLAREDVLIYMSRPLVEPVTIEGPVSASLFVSSSAVDTDFTVKLMDVYPDWMTINVQDGIRRMRYRDGQDGAAFMTPGEVYEAEVDLWSTAYAFNRGHRIAIAISSSNFPRFDINPNTGGLMHEGGPTEIANQRVYQGGHWASRITLPVVRR